MHTDPKWRLRPLEASELDELYQTRMETDFPSAERPNLSAMRRHMRENLQEIFVLTDGQRDAAYAVCAEANGVILVTLLAVYAEQRGQGTGTALMACLKERYADRRAILLEVEDPDKAADEKERHTRERRIAFYRRASYQQLAGVSHTSFGIPLLPMALPLTDTLANVRASIAMDMEAIYHKILPEWLWAQVITKDTRQG